MFSKPKVLFTHAYFMAADPKEQAIQRPYPPLGILYLSAWLDKHGYDNAVFDTTFSAAEKQRAYLLDQRPDIIAIYTNLMTKLAVLDLLKFIRKEAALKDSLVVLGGPDLRYNVKNYLQAGADILVIGEGEQSMLEIVQAVENGLRPHFGHIPGIAFWDTDGQITETAKRPHLKQLSELPTPNRHKIDYQRYLDTWKRAHGRSSVTVSTQRGCPYTCRWCSTAVYGQSYRRRSAAQVAEELLDLKTHYSPDQVWFVDDVFTVSHKWLRAFHEEVRAREAVIPYECITRAERLNEEVLQLLRESGCFRIWIGAESGSQRIIDAMDRRVEAGRVQDMIIAARRYGIETGTFIMLGYPGEQQVDIAATIEHLKRSNPDLFTITVAYPIRGTGLFEDIKDQLTKEPDWFSSTDRDIDFQRAYPRPYYDYAVRWVVNAVNLHKLQLANQAWSVQGAKLFTKIVLARLAMRYYRGNRPKGNTDGVVTDLSQAESAALSHTA